MIDRLIHALVESKNEAADDVLLEAMRIGNEPEQRLSLSALVRRKSTRGLSTVIGRYDQLPETVQQQVLGNIEAFHHALRESGRSDDATRRMAAIKLIALGRQGKLAYVLSENLHDPEESLSKTAAGALVALARWIAFESRIAQEGRSGLIEAPHPLVPDAASSVAGAEVSERAMLLDDITAAPVGVKRPFVPSPTYAVMIDMRSEIEAAVARAMDVHRGRHSQELLRASLLLCDWPGSKLLNVLLATRHGGQNLMTRRLQQPPDSEHVEAFLLAASHAQLRSHFGVVFSHIAEAPVLDAILRKTHWLKDHQLQLCLHQVQRGAWYSESELAHDLKRHGPAGCAKVAEWIASSGLHDVQQDERLIQCLKHAGDDFGTKLTLFRIAARRRRGASVLLLRALLNETDERLIRMSAREIVRRRPPDFENMLLRLMSTAPDSVRRVIGRALGQAGFEHYWTRFDRLERSTRKQAGRAMLKILPDAVQRLQRKLSTGPVEQRVKALQITQELNLSEALRETLMSLANHPNPRVRSKAVSVLGELPNGSPEVMLQKVLGDSDPRVRANAIEVIESKGAKAFIPLLMQRARAGHNRERANAIKALHRMKVGVASPQLVSMMRDERADHRISALWALKQIGFWQLLREVANMARADDSMKVRRYALAVIKVVSDNVQAGKVMKAG